MNDDCIFCKIVKGEAESSIIYEDQDIVAFLDIHPINPGHTLVIPKTHATNIYDISSENLQNIAKVTKELAIKIKKVLNADGISVFQMNEAGGDQAIMHYHMHIIPRYKGDWFHGEIKNVIQKQQATNPQRSELNSLASQIKKT